VTNHTNFESDVPLTTDVIKSSLLFTKSDGTTSHCNSYSTRI